MEKNGLEVAQNQPHHAIWLYLPTEMWFQIFAWLRATRYIALIGVLSKGFREFMLDYFKSSAQWMNKNMNVAIIGSPAVGKSTMLAQLLLQSRLKNIEHRFSKYVKARPTLAVASHYNTFLNGPQSSNPIVHTPHVKAHNLDTALHKLTFFDTPGCGRRLITAYRICTQANTAILLLQRQKEFDLEWLISCVTAAWTSLTHSHFIIAINYYRSYLTQANWEADQKTLHDRLVKAVPAKLLANIKVIPINALEGFNIYSPHAGIDDSSSWYTGPTLYRALHAIWEKLDYPEERMQTPFSMTVLRTVRVNGIGTVVVGTVNSGCIKPEMKVRVYQSKFQSIQYITVNSIQRHGVNKDEANPSDYIGIAFTNGSISVMSKAGLKLERIAKYGVIIADPSYPPKRVKSFMAAIAITSSKAGQLREGRQYKAIHQGNHIYVQFKSFVQVLDKDHKDLTRKNIRPGDSCLALCEPTQDLWMYPKTTKNQKKDSRDVILITTQRRITAVGRIDSITFEDA